MRKQQPLKVVDYPNFSMDLDYPVRVTRVRVNRKSQAMRVKIEHLYGEQDGRTQEVILPLPVRPSGKTASFMRACGVDVATGGEIDPNDALGKLVMVCFEQGIDPCGDPVASFKQPTKEAHDGTATS